MTDHRVISNRGRAENTIPGNAPGSTAAYREGSKIRDATEDDLAEIGFYSDRPLRGVSL